MKIIWIFAMLFSFQGLYSQATKLSVSVSGVPNLAGKMQISLFNKEEGFSEVGKEYKMVRVDVVANTVTYVWTDLPTGEYAVALYHDANADGICNTNWLGIPNEGYGFSNNIVPRWSAPAFRDCKFSLGASADVKIQLISFW